MLMSDYLYKASHGQTFDSIAVEIYEDENKAAEILMANPEYSSRTVLHGGELLRLPIVPEEQRDGTRAVSTAPWKE